MTTPSLLLKCSNVCIACQGARPAYKAAKYKAQRNQREAGKDLAGQVRAYKRSKGCQRCQRKTPVQKLHFHHRDPATKLFKVAWGVYHVAAALLWKEIEKCDVLCAGCHKKEHR